MSNIIVTVETKENDAIDLAKIFEITPNIKNGIIEYLSGAILLKPFVSRKYKIIAQDAQGERFLRWKLPSTKISAKSPNNPHATHARFTANNLHAKNDCPIRIYLEDDEKKRELIFNIQLQASNNNGNGGNLSSIKDQISFLATEKHRKQEQYIMLRENLDSIDRYNRDISWFETSALLNALFKEKPVITFKQLAKIKKFYTNDISRWEYFIAYLHKIIYPLTLTSHGYFISLSNRDESKVWSDIEQLQSTLEKIGFECFINSGTLLGAIREGALISYDDDVDLAVILKSTTFLEAADEWIRLKNKLNDLGLLNKKITEKSTVHCKIGKAGGASVDLFPAWIVNDRAYIWPHTCGEICTLDLLPLKTITLHERLIKLPQSPEKILCLNYGVNWNIPDSSFKFDWKSAHHKFDCFLSSLKLLESKNRK